MLPQAGLWSNSAGHASTTMGPSRQVKARTVLRITSKSNQLAAFGIINTERDACGFSKAFAGIRAGDFCHDTNHLASPSPLQIHALLLASPLLLQEAEGRAHISPCFHPVVNSRDLARKYLLILCELRRRAAAASRLYEELTAWTKRLLCKRQMALHTGRTDQGGSGQAMSSPSSVTVNGCSCNAGVAQAVDLV